LSKLIGGRLDQSITDSILIFEVLFLVLLELIRDLQFISNLLLKDSILCQLKSFLGICLEVAIDDAVLANYQSPFSHLFVVGAANTVDSAYGACKV
jgi:hypothetical protein